MYSNAVLAADCAPFTVYVVLAAFNESRVIAEVVRQVIGEYGNVVVVDDGSADDTADRARSAGAVVLRHPVNRGQGAALQTAIEYSLARGADCIVTFDSDGQHRVEDIEALTRPIRQGRCDIVMGSRFLGQTENMSWTRGVLLQAGVLSTRVFSRIRVTDAHNGLRAFSRRAAEGVDIRLDRMAHASELMDFVGQSGLNYMEVPVRIRYTDYSKGKGQSSAGAFRIAFDYLVGSLMR